MVAFKIELHYPSPRMVVRALTTFDINIAQVNPYGLRTLMCLVVVDDEHKIDLTSDELRSLYFLNKNGLDKIKAYISCVIGHVLHLKLPDSSSGYKDKYFYITGDI